MLKSFIEYLSEKRVLNKKGQLLYFSNLKDIDKNNSEQVGEVVDCVVTCLSELLKSPDDFQLAHRTINIATFKELFKRPANEIIDCDKLDVKTTLLKYLIKLPLAKSFISSEKSTSEPGWIYIFIVDNKFPANTVINDKHENELRKMSHKRTTTRKGSKLYLKFNFKTYKDKGNKVKIDPNTLVLDVISFHPTNSSELNKKEK